MPTSLSLNEDKIACFYIMTQSFSGPNLNTLCAWHSDASPLWKSHEKFVWPEKLQKHIWTGVPRWAFALLKLWSVLFQNQCPFHSCKYYYNLRFLFVSVDNIPSLTILPWQIIMQTLKLFTVNGYYMIFHWKIKQICSSVHRFWTFS